MAVIPWALRELGVVVVVVVVAVDHEPGFHRLTPQ